VAYRREASARVAQAMPAQALPVAKDATSSGGLGRGAMAPKRHDLLLEQAAPARAHDTWQARLAPALSGRPCQGIPSPRAAAPGLRASVAQPLGAPPSPDVCHGQPARGTAVSGSRATPPRAAPKAATARLAPRAQEAPAAHQACARLSAPRAQVAQRRRASGPASHGVAGERGGRRNGTRLAAARQAPIARVRTVAPPAGRRQSGVDRRGPAARVGLKRPAPLAGGAGEVRHQVAPRDVTPPVSDAMPAQRLPSCSLERVARPRTGSAGEPWRQLAAGLRTARCEPGGALATWSEAAPSARQPQAPERAAVCQRARANVAGRHGALALRHHQRRG
jgi:hypothetical protein